MTNMALVGDDDVICDAGFDGIGRRTAEHLEAVGIASVRQLAEANATDLAAALEPSFPNLRTETLGARAERWISQARERLRSANERSARGHVFLLTLWTDSDGRPVRSRIDYRDPGEPTSEATTADMAGWSPVAFVRFVERMAELVAARSLTDERIEPATDVVEWSHHQVEGPLIRGRSMPIEIRAQVSTEDLDSGDGRIRFRATGRLAPLGGGQPIAVGTCFGRADHGLPMVLEFGAHRVADRVHRGLVRRGGQPTRP